MVTAENLGVFTCGISVLFLDEDGFPAASDDFKYISGEFLKIHVPDNAKSARMELDEKGFVLARLEFLDSEGAGAAPINALSSDDGDFFAKNSPRYKIGWPDEFLGPLSLKITVTRLTADEAMGFLLPAMDGLRAELASGQSENERLTRAFEDIFNSRAWRAVRAFYSLKDIAKLGVKKAPIIRRPLLKLASLFRLRPFSNPLRPLRTRVREAEKLYRASERSVYNIGDLPELPSGAELPSIAVHLHLFYIDLLDDFFNRLSNIPIKYDLFVSVAREEHAEIVRSRFEKQANIGGVTVEVTENRGRDIAPMINVFGPRLLDYDIFLHIHTKKSPHSGELKNWRDELLGSLLENPRHVERILGLFLSRPDLGVLYPEPHESFPYWTLTSHGNIKGLRDISRQTGIDFDESDTYLDFPAGSMFWARGRALEPLLIRPLNGFPDERGQVDGTLAHAAERFICLTAQTAGYINGQINMTDGIISLGPGLKNLQSYIAMDYQRAVSYIRQFKRAVFDIFGTLVYAESRETLWIRMEALTFPGFAEARAEAERVALSQSGASDIHNVYYELGELTGVGTLERERLKALEFELLLESCRPRKVMAGMARSLGEGRTAMACDTVWPKAYVIKILNKCQIEEPKDLFLSSELGAAKRDGSMFGYIRRRFKNRDFINIGGDEWADAQVPNNMRIHSFHVMNPETMAKIVGFGDERMIDDPFCLLGLMRERETDITRSRITEKYFT